MHSNTCVRFVSYCVGLFTNTRLSAHQASPHVVPVSTGSVHKKGPLRGKIRSLFFVEGSGHSMENRKIEVTRCSFYINTQQEFWHTSYQTFSSISKWFVLILKGYLNKTFSALFGVQGSLFLSWRFAKVAWNAFYCFYSIFFSAFLSSTKSTVW